MISGSWKSSALANYVSFAMVYHCNIQIHANDEIILDKTDVDVKKPSAT